MFVMVDSCVLFEVRTEFLSIIWTSFGFKRILLEGTQAMLARPSDKDRMGVKTLGWWVVKA
jgi:hypothetical protein